MSWHGADAIVKPVLDALVDEEASSMLQIVVTSALVKACVAYGWGDAEQMLGEYSEHPNIVDGFGDAGVYLITDPRHPDYGTEF